MGRTITVTVPGRPSRWQRPGQGIDPRTGGPMRFTDKKAEAGKQNIAAHARRAYAGLRPATGPVLVRVIAVFAIPPSWPAGLRQAARECRVMHVQDPDLDQLVKQAKDALKGIAYVDDNQVVGYPNSAKRYGSPERTEITIQVLDQRPDEVTPGQRQLEHRIATEGWEAVLAPPRRAREHNGHADPDGALAARSARRRNKTKSGTAEPLTGLERAIAAALERDGGTDPASGGLFGRRR